MILLASWCARRFGELTELRRSDVDLEHGRIHVSRGVTWVNGQPVVDARGQCLRRPSGTLSNEAEHRYAVA